MDLYEEGKGSRISGEGVSTADSGTLWKRKCIQKEVGRGIKSFRSSQRRNSLLGGNKAPEEHYSEIVSQEVLGVVPKNNGRKPAGKGTEPSLKSTVHRQPGPWISFLHCSEEGEEYLQFATGRDVRGEEGELTCCRY